MDKIVAAVHSEEIGLAVVFEGDIVVASFLNLRVETLFFATSFDAVVLQKHIFLDTVVDSAVDTLPIAAVECRLVVDQMIDWVAFATYIVGQKLVEDADKMNQQPDESTSIAAVVVVAAAADPLEALFFSELVAIAALYSVVIEALVFDF